MVYVRSRINWHRIYIVLSLSFALVCPFYSVVSFLISCSNITVYDLGWCNNISHAHNHIYTTVGLPTLQVKQSKPKTVIHVAVYMLWYFKELYTVWGNYLCRKLVGMCANAFYRIFYEILPLKLNRERSYQYLNMIKIKVRPTGSPFSTKL